MSEEYTGACVVLVPSQNGLPDTVEGGQHITLAYLGDKNLDDALELELLRIVGALMDNSRGHIRIETEGLDLFGEDRDAVVVTLDSTDSSPAVLLRTLLLQEFSSELTHLFNTSQTYKDYRPHMTLGYISEGFDEKVFDIPKYLDIQGIGVWNGESRTLIHNRDDEEIRHYGILKKSGRYPWGSGSSPYQRSKAFYSAYNQLKAEGLNDVQISRLFGEQSTPQNPDFNTASLRRTRSLAKDEKRAGDRAQILRMRDKGMSTQAIGDRLNIAESQVRALMKDSVEERTNITKVTAEKLREQISEDRYLDIGKGTEHLIGVSPDRLKTAVAILKDEGYKQFNVMETQLGTGKETNVKVLALPGTRFPEVVANKERISVVDVFSTDGGRTFETPGPPKSVSSKKLEVVYAEDGGTDRDGLIEIRPGATDLDLGHNRYVQVRIAVDGTHYLKGMAVYNPELPKGTDIRFNTNKAKGTPPLGEGDNTVLKHLKTDKDGNLDLTAPFGSQIKPGGQRGAVNVVNEEGDWDEWSKKLSSQMLSKQNERLAKQQLGLTQKIKADELAEISALTNPTVKSKLLESFADNADSQATTLKAMALPRTNNKVIIPFPDMKPTEVYAPTYKNGEKVVLIRHPHGGTFEIPELTVNNRHKAAKTMLADAKDAIGISPAVAEQLSGADFDGDTVLVIPQTGGAQRVKVSKPLKGLENFDPKIDYKGYEGMKVMSNTQRQMGEISNLITDMTIRGANEQDVAAAVRHSMVVIDAEKHKLNYRQSAIDNGIKRLKDTYQPEGGASTIISRAKSRVDVPKKKLRAAKDGGPIDKDTGALVWVETGESYDKEITNKKTGETTTQTIVKKQKSRAMDETSDARSLVSSPSGTPIEMIYADHANTLKGIANQARKEMINTPNLERSPSAAKAYAPEVANLTANLNRALKNAPLERQAQIVGNAIVKAKMDARPDLDSDDLKKVKARALEEARLRTGAKKADIPISDREWEAIQAGAVSNSRLKEILNHTDLDRVKELATPRSTTSVTPAKLARAQAMLSNGFTQAEVAEALGMSVSTLSKALR